MLQILKSSKIRTCIIIPKGTSFHSPRTLARIRHKSSRAFDFANFDPHANPNEASAIYTSLGWFFIPLKYNTDKQPRLLLDQEFKRNRFTTNTNHEKIQQFIYKWCQDYTPTIYKKKMSSKIESEQKKLQLLFRQQMSDKIHTEEEAKAKEIERANKANGVSDKLRFKLDPQTQQVEIRGILKMTNVFNYYIQKQTQRIQSDADYKKSPLTTREIRSTLSKDWSGLSPEKKDAVKQEYLKLLSSGKDYHLGEVVDLDSRLSDEVSEDGFRFKKSKIVNKHRA
ncbi:hypothetical protein CANMA_004056 [Candida margitis]|uniref:uncharacterized protein n=1 Tax=Candida margitis TaxID=1775924 RepID=UPI002227DAF5|nr:uncharacterized protein CANMA_004056 [Candida margitis]KAI5960219.1 hypothetical protein CANMA_004056 [Candida margitis]